MHANLAVRTHRCVPGRACVLAAEERGPAATAGTSCSSTTTSTLEACHLATQFLDVARVPHQPEQAAPACLLPVLGHVHPAPIPVGRCREVDAQKESLWRDPETVAQGLLVKVCSRKGQRPPELEPEQLRRFRCGWRERDEEEPRHESEKEAPPSPVPVPVLAHAGAARDERRARRGLAHAGVASMLKMRKKSSRSKAL